MKALNVVLILLCMAGLVLWDIASRPLQPIASTTTDSHTVPAANGHATKVAADVLPATKQVGQHTLGGFVAVWSMRQTDPPASSTEPEPSAAAVAEVEARRAQHAAAHAREVKQVSIRMLELQAKQDPARAYFYLAQATSLSASTSIPALAPSRHRQEASERQRRTNEYMSAKMDQLRAAQKVATTSRGDALVVDAQTLRPGDRAGPRPGDVAGGTHK